MGSVGNTQLQSVNRVSLYGEEYDLPDTLEYANSKYPIPDSMKDFEKRRKNQKIEYGTLINSQGYTITGDIRGSRGQVQLYVRDVLKADSYTHIHPRHEFQGLLGGTFSSADVSLMTDYNNINFIRAVAPEGIYTLSRNSGFEKTAAQFLKEYENQNKIVDAKVQQAVNDANKAFRSRQISAQEYHLAQRDANNQMLIDLHKWLVANQKKYGYKYQLEER